ncbi:phage repressor protein CI [Entomohabitans teleogrylli]|uniref:phage repressor protein CI n=1 Tax=Entomohabitans teleogrylli TaxID=1384589 RepID=UPI00073D6A6C|nr:phage repressor protein CI [Entomohabitans teleogrylli]
MKIRDYTFEAVSILDRICEIYGFRQKIQLADHFEISASSLSNRYTRGTISYDFAAICALETGASLKWLLTGEGEQYSENAINSNVKEIPSFTLSEERLTEDSPLSIDLKLINKPESDCYVVRADGKLHFIDRDSTLSDGLWLVNIDDAISIRELTKLPGKKLHVAGGKVPFECGIDEIKALGRVIGFYSDAS